MSLWDKDVSLQAAFARSYVQWAVGGVPINQAAVRYGTMHPVRWAGATMNIQGASQPTPPWACRGYFVENAQVFCTAVVATASIDIVGQSGVSMLSALITPVAGTVVQGAMTTNLILRRQDWGNLTAGPQGDLRVQITTNGTGTITNLIVTVTIRPVPLGAEVIG